MKHHIFLTATVLSLPESYAKYGGKVGIDSVLSNDNVVLLLLQKCYESHQESVHGDSRVIHNLHIYIVRVTTQSQFTCTFLAVLLF